MALSHFRPGLTTFVLLLSIAVPTKVAPVQTPDRQALLDLNRQLLESVFVRGETAMLASAALPRRDKLAHNCTLVNLAGMRKSSSSPRSSWLSVVVRLI